MKKTLWIVSELFPPDETSTAIILGEIANLMVKVYEVRVICGPAVYDRRKNTDSNSKFHLDPGIIITRSKAIALDKNSLWGRAIRYAVISWNLYKTAKRNIKDGDKVLQVTNPAPAVVLISNLKKKRNFEFNILVHDVFPENTKPARLKIPVLFYGIIKKIFDRSYSRADQLIVLGRDMKRVMEQKVSRFSSYPYVTVIENWADLDMVNPMESQTRHKGIILEYAGNIGRVQGLLKVIEYIREADNDQLFFHIWGTGAEEKNLMAYVANNEIKNITFHGPFLRSNQNEVLNSCDVALVTLADGMYGLGVPSKSYNIMAAGKPILFLGDPRSEIGLLLMEKRIGFVFDPLDREGITEFMARLSPDNHEELKAMGMHARDVAEKEFAKKIILKKFLNAI